MSKTRATQGDDEASAAAGKQQQQQQQGRKKERESTRFSALLFAVLDAGTLSRSFEASMAAGDVGAARLLVPGVLCCVFVVEFPTLCGAAKSKRAFSLCLQAKTRPKLECCRFRWGIFVCLPLFFVCICRD